MGTGSGAIAVSVAHTRPDALVTALDVSEEALAVARANAARLGLDVRFARADLLDGVGEVDAVVSNPPYVEDGAELAPEIARHEPAGALYAGLDGLDVVRRLVAQAGERGVGFLALEVGDGQALAVEELARAAGFGRVERRADLAGIERVVAAWR
jgi:release factor glutamine methyltransferase